MQGAGCRRGGQSCGAAWGAGEGAGNRSRSADGPGGATQSSQTGTPGPKVDWRRGRGNSPEIPRVRWVRRGPMEPASAATRQYRQAAPMLGRARAAMGKVMSTWTGAPGLNNRAAPNPARVQQGRGERAGTKGEAARKEGRARTHGGEPDRLLSTVESDEHEGTPRGRPYQTEVSQRRDAGATWARVRRSQYGQAKGCPRTVSRLPARDGATEHAILDVSPDRVAAEKDKSTARARQQQRGARIAESAGSAAETEAPPFEHPPSTARKASLAEKGTQKNFQNERCGERERESRGAARGRQTRGGAGRATGSRTQTVAWRARRKWGAGRGAADWPGNQPGRRHGGPAAGARKPASPHGAGRFRARSVARVPVRGTRASPVEAAETPAQHPGPQRTGGRSRTKANARAEQRARRKLGARPDGQCKATGRTGASGGSPASRSRERASRARSRGAPSNSSTYCCGVPGLLTRYTGVSAQPPELTRLLVILCGQDKTQRG